MDLLLVSRVSERRERDGEEGGTGGQLLFEPRSEEFERKNCRGNSPQPGRRSGHKTLDLNLVGVQ